MGPFRMSDLAGNDISWHIRKRHYAEHPKQRNMRIADRVCELGRFGQKTGLGWYRYEAGKRDALPDPVVDKIIDEERKALKIAPREIPDAEIVDRLLYRAGQRRRAHARGRHCTARLRHRRRVSRRLRFSRAARRTDVLREPRRPRQVVRRMKEFAANPTCEPAFWKPAKLITQLAAAGKTFDDAPQAEDAKEQRRG